MTIVPESNFLTQKQNKKEARQEEERKLIVAIPDTCFPPNPLASFLNQLTASYPLDDESHVIPKPVRFQGSLCQHFVPLLRI